MGAMDARRLELFELLKPKLDEEAAKALVLALSPDPDRLVTIDVLDDRFEKFGGQMDAKFSHMDVRFAQLDVRFAQMDARLAQMESTLTRRMVTIMGAWTILVASAFSWAALLLR